MIKLEPVWKLALEEEFSSAYMNELSRFLQQEKASGKVIYPPGDEIFAALNSTPLDQVKVVILGQDPYHGPGQAHGLCFSVKPGVVVPPSLKNIYKELAADIDFKAPAHGNLNHWAEQGVLLLNSVLTVASGNAGSHQGKGGEKFTDRVVRVLNHSCSNLVFLLWGSYAQKKGAMIDNIKHCVLQSPHPSPLSASRGFFDNHHFSQANEYLHLHNKLAIDWQLPLEVEAAMDINS